MPRSTVRPPVARSAQAPPSTVILAVVALAVVLMFGSAPEAQAQYLLGIKVGSGSTSLNGDRPPDGTYTGHRGFSIGALLGVSVGDGIFLIAEPGIVERGSGLAFAVPGQEEPRDSVDLSLGYVTLPVGLRVLSKSGRIFVTSTVDFSYLTSAEVDEGSGPRDVSEAVNELAVGVRFSVGMHVPIGRPVVTVEFGYGQSVRNLANEGASTPDWDFPPRFQVRGFRLSGGLQVNVGGGS
jgi:hypothetical protein